MTDAEKINALNAIAEEWDGIDEEVGYIAMTVQAITCLYNQANPDNLLNGDDVINLIGYKDDYKLSR